MNNLVARQSIPTMSKNAVDAVRQIEALAATTPQTVLAVEHFLHGGMYARTVKLPASILVTGAFIRLATILIVNGDTEILLDEGWVRFQGYAVLPAQAGRKQAFKTKKPTHLTMLFATNAKTVREAEDEFTDEAYMLQTRRVV